MRALRAIGQLDLVISLGYLVLLGFVGTLMMIEAVRALIKRRAGIVMRERMPRQHNWVHGLPMRIRFKKSKLYISVLPVLGLGLVIGFLGSLLGIGGGFILVPALVYLLRVPGNIVLGTSLLQVVAMMSATMILHAISSQSVDILLAFCLMVGGVIGAQFGAQAGQLSQGRAAALPSRGADHRGGAAVRRLAGHSARAIPSAWRSSRPDASHDALAGHSADRPSRRRAGTGQSGWSRRSATRRSRSPRALPAKC